MRARRAQGVREARRTAFHGTTRDGERKSYLGVEEAIAKTAGDVKVRVRSHELRRTTFATTSDARRGGERGIRTPGTLPGSVVFKTTAIDHSAIPPRRNTATSRALFLYLTAIRGHVSPDV